METRAESDVTAVLLAGGAATRMGGVDKGLVLMSGKPLVEHVLQRIVPQVAGVVISANRNREKYAGYGFPVVGDVVTGFCGPLVGIASACAEVETEFVVTMPCDSPFIPLDYVTKLRSAFDGNPDLRCAAVVSCGKTQPVFMMIRKDLSAEMLEYVAEGGRKVGFWLAEHGVKWVEFERLEDFDNLNTPEDLQKAEAK